MTQPTLRLVREADKGGWIDALADLHGGRAGLDALLGDLDRQASSGPVPVRAATYGFRWSDDDFDSEEWWPQGVTTSADASDIDDVGGRRLVVVGWYAKPVSGPSRGTRLSFVDVTEEASPRYRHVLLVQSGDEEAAGIGRLRPVRVHAGGIVWYGSSILVADTHGGVRVFHLDDILRLGGDGFTGYRYVLPQRSAYKPRPDEGFEPFRFSFVSLDRSGDNHLLIAGEYGINGQSTRLVTFGLDASSEALVMTDGAAHPVQLIGAGRPHMQGAATVSGTLYISTSRGRSRRGSMWTKPADGRPREHRGSLAVGPEDLCYWPQRDQLWSVSEYPGQRYVYAMPRAAFDVTRWSPLSSLRALFG